MQAAAARQIRRGKFREVQVRPFVYFRLVRLIEIRERYAQRVFAFQGRYREEMGGGGEEEEKDDDALFFGRLEAGLLTSQMATTVLAYLVISGDPKLSKQTLLLLHSADVGLHDLKSTLAELRDSMGEERPGSTVTNNRAKMESLCAKLDELCKRLVRRPPPSEEMPPPMLPPPPRATGGITSSPFQFS
ncbi:hypothetical protein T492DRAFT_440232 [Pavlovales sp. CCMP2436]|nr:hypothetical protein T492DRAFT_440232 [Pavlovales sp. CCMP2436]